MSKCSVEGCSRPHVARGLCRGHYMRQYRRGDVGATELHDRSQFHLEDIEWMAETGETWVGAIARLQAKPKTVERFLYRHDRADLIATLKARQSPLGETA